MSLGARSAPGMLAALLLGAGLGLQSPRAGGPDEDVLFVIPARTVGRILTAARSRSRELPGGYRLLEELTLPHASVTREPTALVVTPRVASLLARKGLKGFLSRALRASGSNAPLGGDTTPPAVEWTSPSAGTTLTPELATTLEWTSSDPSGILFVDLTASFDGGATFQLVEPGLPGGSRQLEWFPPYRPGGTILRVEATDGAFNVGHADREIALATVLAADANDGDRARSPVQLPERALPDFEQPQTTVPGLGRHALHPLAGRVAVDRDQHLARPQAHSRSRRSRDDVRDDDVGWRHPDLDRNGCRTGQRVVDRRRTHEHEVRLLQPAEHLADDLAHVFHRCGGLGSWAQLGADGLPVEAAELRVVVRVVDRLPDVVEAREGRSQGRTAALRDDGRCRNLRTRQGDEQQDEGRSHFLPAIT